MSIVAEFVIPAGAFPGEDTLRELPEATIRLERLVPTDEGIEPFFWVTGVDAEAFLETVRTEPRIDDVRMLARLDPGVLFHARWTPEPAIVEGIKTLRGTILDAVGHVDEWTFQVVADDRRRLQAFQRVFADQGVHVELKRVSNLADDTGGEASLTPEQRRTLVAAYREGYYDQPRRVTQGELGERFGVTGRAISNRLRRGTKNLIASNLVESTDRDPW